MTPVTKSALEQALADNPWITQAGLERVLDLTRNQVIQNLKKYGLKTANGHAQQRLNDDPDAPRFRVYATKAEIEHALDKYLGVSQKGLAGLFGVSRRSMRDHLSHYGLKTDRTIKHDPAKIHALFNAGHDTPQKMSAALGVLDDTARRWMVECKLWKGTARADIRQLLPLCVACTDPVDDDPTWGGANGLHFGCAQHMLFQRVVVLGGWVGLYHERL